MAVDAYIVMLNHFHGIIVIDAPTVGAVRKPHNIPTIPRKPLGRLIGAFKTVSTKRINVLHATPSKVFWQRNNPERIIRHEHAHDYFRRYIMYNRRTTARIGFHNDNPIDQYFQHQTHNL